MWHLHPRTSRILCLWLVVAGVMLSSYARADLEPRFIAPAPVGMNSAIVGYSYSVGNVMLDEALPIEGTESRLNAVTVGYGRTIDVFGLMGRAAVIVPLATGRWTGRGRRERRQHDAQWPG